MPAELKHTLDFLRDLRANNNREWFQAHQAEYKKARGAYENLIAEVISRFDPVEPLPGVTPADVMYRINRDIRFSKDKSPYKIAMGALIGSGGRNTPGTAYYIQIQPDGGSLVASGRYVVFPAELKAIRDGIAADPQALRRIIEAKSFKKLFGEMTGDQLKTTPRDYPKDHPAADLLRFKNFEAVHRLTDDEVLADDLPDQIIELCLALKPFANYFYKIVKQADLPPMPERRR